MNELPAHSEKSSGSYPISSEYLELEEAPGFASILPPMPLHIVYKRNREVLPEMLRLQKPSQFDRPPSYEEFVL